MRPYQREAPAIFIHIPKTAGATVRQTFRAWLGDDLIPHYPNEQKGTLPSAVDLACGAEGGRGKVVYGHFNMDRGFGIPDHYPEVKQFFSILRDPFEAAISNYYYTKRTMGRWRDKSQLPTEGLRAFLRTRSPNMLNHFPRPVTKENHKELIEAHFVVLGLTERLEESLSRMAAAMGFDFDGVVSARLNESPRAEEDVSDLRDEYRDRHPLEFLVYDYACARFAQAGGEAR